MTPALVSGVSRGMCARGSGGSLTIRTSLLERVSHQYCPLTPRPPGSSFDSPRSGPARPPPAPLRRAGRLTVSALPGKSRVMALRFADHEFAALAEFRWHPEAKRIRAFVDGVNAVDSTRARIVWEPRRIVPSFAVPVRDIDGALVAVESDTAEEHPVRLGDG